MAHFAVLGPLAIESPPGHWPVLRGERQKTLLAVLLLNANQYVHVDVLVEALWPDLPPKSYTSNLHTYVSRLRDRIDGLVIENGPPGYRLQVGPDELDLLVFRAAAAAGQVAARAGDAAGASRHLRRALAQWRGPVLAGLHVPRLDADAARLESERLAVFEDCVDAELSAGRHGDLTGELQAMITEHPLRERLAAQLMIALHRAGLQSDSLEIYRRLRTTLIEELGVEPGAEVRRVHAAVLRGEDPVPRVVPQPVWPLCQLPPDIADFAGRDAELAELTALLDGPGVPVAVLSGEPGAGKSALAVRAAHRLRAKFPDGQLFVPLAGASEARAIGDVLADLLRALGVTGPAIPDDVQARSAVYRGRLTDRRVLVVLDDAADPDQVRALLPGTPGCAVLVTSRWRLSGLAGARRLALGPLSDAEAARLLEGLAGARVEAEPADAARIAAACDNLPLALRIAGSRLAIRPHLRLAQLADRLEDEVRRLDELTVRDLGVRGSIALSYKALRPLAQRAFRLIGRCRNLDSPGWAITTLIDDPGADEAVDELVEASLLEVTGEDRYRLHDLVRLYATELDASADGRSGVRSVLNAALALADAAASRLPRTVPMPAIAGEPPTLPLPDELVARLLARPEMWFAAERANLTILIRTLCELGRGQDALWLLDRLSVYLYLHGHYADMRASYEAVLAVADPRAAAIAEANLTLLRHARGQYEEAAVGYRECAKKLEEHGERGAQTWVSANLAHCLIGLGRAEESLQTSADTRELCTVDGEEAALVWVSAAESSALHRLGRVAEALDVDRAGLAQARRSGDPRQIGVALHGVSWSLLLNDEPVDAAAAIGESVDLLRTTMARSTLAKSLRTLGAIEALRGERETAVEAYGEARELARELDERPRELSCTRALAAGWIGEGRATRAIPVLRGCLDEFREMGGRAAVGLTWQVLHRAYDVTGAAREAEEAAAEAAKLANPRDASAAALRRALLALTQPVG